MLLTWPCVFGHAKTVSLHSKFFKEKKETKNVLKKPQLKKNCAKSPKLLAVKLAAAKQLVVKLLALKQLVTKILVVKLSAVKLSSGKTVSGKSVGGETVGGETADGEISGHAFCRVEQTHKKQHFVTKFPMVKFYAVNFPKIILFRSEIGG